MNKVYLGIILILSLLSVSCVTSQPQYITEYITEYQDVYIPIMCDVNIRARPLWVDKPLKDLLNDIILYTENLEADIRYCKGGTDVSTE